MGTRQYVFAIIRDNEYDTDSTFTSAACAVFAAVELGEKVAVLDALSLEFLGII